ncbi:hypothetical protein B0H16DRAFT_1762096 [Mycena metata]|uniref:Uncharacterized protein n=1 Tax=Mycena metata TaxID=1033252 RepID=A0AAD7I9F6_9AGAR|nr:hypothetical protein B0H16DRAFT_1762096 [Mycena metata]
MASAPTKRRMGCEKGRGGGGFVNERQHRDSAKPRWMLAPTAVSGDKERDDEGEDEGGNREEWNINAPHREVGVYGWYEISSSEADWGSNDSSMNSSDSSMVDITQYEISSSEAADWGSNDSSMNSSDSSTVDITQYEISSSEADWGSNDSSMNSSGSSAVDLAQHEISSAEAKTFLGWEWQKSSTVWLDEGVSSKVCHFSPPLEVSKRTRVSHIECVTGLPSQFPIPSQATAFLIDVTNIPHLNPDSTVDAILKDQDVHSWGGSTGSRSKVDAYVPGFFSIALIPRPASPVVVRSQHAAELPARVKFYHSSNQYPIGDAVQSIRQPTGAVAAGKKGRNVCPFNHIKEGRPFEAKVIHIACKADLFVFVPHEDKHPALARKCIVVPDHAHPYRHSVPPPSKVTHAVAEKYRECVRKFGLANSTKEILGGLTPSLYHLALVSRDTKTRLINEVKSEPGNQTKQENQTVESYVAAQRGLPDETRYIYFSEREGRTTIFGIHHGIIKYIHKVRTLDCDTTFKPVVGKTDVYEINGWMPGINAELTLGRVWIKFHDHRSFQLVWEELLSLVKRLTNQRLGFKALHRSGTLLGFNADMEAAPLLGMADALLSTIDLKSVAEEVGGDPISLLKLITRITSNGSFSLSGFTSSDGHCSGLPDLSHLPHEDQDRVSSFMYLETPEDVEEFKLWIRSLPDPNDVILHWWEHKEMHEWLLPAAIECLTDMASDDWHVIEATTNFGEAQHKANNAQTGINMGLVESFIQYEILDTRRAAEIETMLQSGNLHNPRNEVSHRYANRNRRRVHATEKVKHARVEQEDLRAAEEAVADAQAHLKQMRAESNVWSNPQSSNSSGRVPPRPRKSQSAKSVHPDTPVSDVRENIGDAILPVSESTLGEHETSPNRKRPASTSLESDMPPKRLKLGPLKGWGVQRNGVNLSAIEYAQNHWNNYGTFTTNKHRLQARMEFFASRFGSSEWL